MDIYKDMLAKAKIYKKQIINDFVKRGYFPTDKDISARLESIETRTALCEAYLSKPGSLFNTKEFNYMFEMIYKDLTLLYEILQDILLNEYNQLKVYIEAHLNTLETKASLFQRRLDEEMAATSLGKLLFVKTDDWKLETNDTVTTIDLGNIEFNQASKIALFADISNIDNKAVSFKLISEEDKSKSFDALPYNYNNDTYIIPGTKKINETDLNLNGRIIVNDAIKINTTVNANNDYKILGGKNKMTVRYAQGDEFIIDFASQTNVFEATQDCTIEFYCYNNPTIEYNMNKKPNHCNFSISDGYIHIDTKDVKKVYLNVPKGFVCYFVVNEGEIYASCEDGIVLSNDQLSYSGNWDLRDFKLLEYANNENKITYNVKVLINTDKNILSDINSVCIKQIG